MPDVTQAESSTAVAPPVVPVEPAEPAEPKTLETLTNDERQQWIRGKLVLPDVEQPPKEASAPSPEPAAEVEEPAAEPSAEAPDKKDGAKETAPASDPGKPEKPKAKGHDGTPAPQRVKELLAEKKAGEARIKELEAQLSEKAAKPGEDTAESPTVIEEPTETKPEVQTRPTRPIYDHFETDEAFQQAMDAYEDKVVDWKLAVKESERAQQAEQAKIAEANRKIETSWKTRVKAAQEKHEDYDTVFSADAPLPINRTMDGFILDSPEGAEILYYLTKNPERAAELAAMPAWQCARELVKLETSLSEPPKKAEEPVEPKPPAPPKPKVTSALPPVADVGGRGAAPSDELEAALQRGDFPTYQRLRNEADRRK